MRGKRQGAAHRVKAVVCEDAALRDIRAALLRRQLPPHVPPVRWLLEAQLLRAGVG